MERETVMIKKLRYIFNRKQKIEAFLLLIMTVIGAGLELLGVSAILPLVDVILNPTVLDSEGIYTTIAGYLGITSHRAFCIFLCLAMILIYLIKNAYLVVQTYAQVAFSANNRYQMTCRMFRAYIHQEYLFHTNHNVADIQRNIVTDIERSFQLVLSGLMLMTEFVTILVLSIFLVYLDIMTAVIMAGFVGILFVVFAKTVKKIQSRLSQAQRNASAKKTKVLLESFAGIKDIQVMDKEAFFCKEFECAYGRENKATRRTEFLTRSPKYVMETIIMVAMLSVVAIRLAMHADINEFLSVLSVYAIAAVRLLPSANRLIEYMNNISSRKAYIDGLYDSMHLVIEYEAGKTAPLEEEELSFAKEIRVDNLSYWYPEAKEDLLDHVSLRIAKNESVAFIGGSGAGKTTLADILLGLLPPRTGAVLVDGCDIHENIHGWHGMIGYVPQTIYLTDDTIRNNVAFGIPAQLDQDDAVWKALERAQLTDFVKSLPDGLDTIVGDRGVRLSGGQRQRIGIARALYHNPQVLILDEATSALDNDTEKAIMEAIENLKGKTTLIIIAHRLTTIRNCDRVFEVRNKGILERDKREVLK